MPDFPWIASIFSGLVGALIGVIAQSILTRETITHERRTALFQFEVSQIQKAYDLIYEASQVADDYYFTKVSAMRLLYSQNRIVRTQPELRLMNYKLYNTPITMNREFKDKWDEFVEAFTDATALMIQMDESQPQRSEDKITSAYVKATDLRREVYALLEKALKNFSQGKPLW